MNERNKNTSFKVERYISIVITGFKSNDSLKEIMFYSFRGIGPAKPVLLHFQPLEIISVKRDCRSDTISKIVSNTDAAENSWSLERTNQTTTTNGRTFGSSNSHTTNDEKSFEESKNLSIENTISKINTSEYNNPIDDKCYSYIITPKIKTEAVVWACLNSNKYNDEKVKFIHSESMIEYFKDYIIINRTDCSNSNNVKGIKF
ncbi:hypothetical protein H8356DRAFT_1322072 [Neocallimastix lanati (nom. inval.)]|nr:hypothetical protein H8356DRAFT_1322072 [Neocallimastix sp. JGI-2020a]